MTTNHHTAIATGAAANAAVINSPLEELDAAFAAANKPQFLAHKNGATQAISAATDTKITWTTEVFDTNGYFASSRFTPLVAGTYQFNLTFRTDGNTDQSRIYARIYKNGAESASKVLSASGTILQSNSVNCIAVANGSTDYFEAYIYADNAVTLNGTVTQTYFSGFKIAGV